MHTRTFKTPAKFFEALLGPAQHDAHVATWRGHTWLTERLAASRRGLDAAAACVAETAEQEAQKIAIQHGYDTAALRREHHRWTAGCFVYEPFSKKRARQIGRALDIAIERHAMSEAAE